ncbi:FAD-dependent oxidoreductase [Anaerococcus sp. AGMB00486]|uniref:FAD-dependent oxidoreductase n=2 Tax=Anaerococcus TaxID=165779 RepID=A0ABX2NBH7_9FIRM|nr:MULTISPECIES: NAD(P)/FAD-dependent oxidoreductase [Anaerococcus]MDY3006647.1 NAD(P)/FAD-dependent oxidoreductase [Anaerococcus porci]MSS78114.1 NAD(P)/FAD-dependent oxidoreductase [Anaerococcus porci]NVF12082.1 FAD-dependent oxidoreductase [Anaerococcus faecalis]
MFDAIIIGGGVTGTSIAYNLSKKKGKFLLIEKNEDLCTETSKANSGICHGGYDAKPGSMKAKMNVLGNHMMEEISKKLSFPYKKIGTLVLCHSEADMDKLQKLYDQGIENGVSGMKILNRQEVLELEPNVTDDVVAALFCEEAGILDPFLMTIAFGEVSNINGVDYVFNEKVIDTIREDDYWIVKTEKNTYKTKTIVNAAGIHSDEIHNKVSDEKYEIRARRGEYLLLDKDSKGFVKHVMFNLPTEKGKGILVSPTIDENTLVGPTSDFIDDKEDKRSTREHIEEVIEKSNDTVKNVPVRMVITSFSGNRAHEKGEDFILKESLDGFFDCIGIESPGLTSAPAIGDYMANLVSEKLKLEEKENFIYDRKPTPKTSEMSLEEHDALIKKDKRYGKIICRCESVTEGEIVDAINRPLGARTVDGVKRRVRATAGRCQGGFCLPRVMEILARELDIPYDNVVKNAKGSYYIRGHVK